MPTVSVIIPTHSRPKILKAAIKSVLDQTYSDLEIIVVDDGLKERAQSVVEKFSDSRMRYIQHEVEKGGGAARNTGIKNSTGKFIAFLDDDDEWLPDKLEIQMGEFSQSDSDVGFSHTAVKIEYPNHTTTTHVTAGVHDFSKYVLRWFSEFLTVTLMVKREVFNSVGMFDEEFPSHQETDLMIRICQRYKGLGIDRPLTIVHVSTDSIGNDIQKRIVGRKLILKKHVALYANNPDVLAHQEFELGLMYRDSGDYKLAKSQFKKAIAKNFSFLFLRHYLSMAGNGFLYSSLTGRRSRDVGR